MTAAGRRAGKRLAFALAPLLLLVGVAEVALRLVPERRPYATRSGFVEADPDLVWRLVRRDDGPLATNELGLRDGAYRGDADTKVLLVGDSVAWGDGIDETERVFPQLLERRLASALPGRTVEVINASVPGYSTFQEVAYLERDGLALDPHLVILQFSLNDVVERYHSLAQYGGSTHFLGVDTRQAVRGLYGSLLRSSAAFRTAAGLVQGGVRRLEVFRSARLLEEPLEPALERAWVRVEGELGRFLELTRSRELGTLLVIVPLRFQLTQPQRRQAQDRLLRFAARNGLAAVDLLPPLSGLDGHGGVLYHDETHFSRKGHEAVAELLEPAVLRALDQSRLEGG